MTTTEFSQAFDAQIAAYNDSPAVGTAYNRLEFNEYEKSVFLTRAQDDLVLSYYSGKNSYNEGFEYTEEIRRYLSSLVNTTELSPLSDQKHTQITKYKTTVFKLPTEVWFITYEAVRLPSSESPCANKKIVEVIPVTQDELHKVVKNPFKGPTSNRALRLDIYDNKVQIVSTFETIDKYIVRFVEEPSPIILEDLPDDTTIKSQTTEATCLLHPALHKAILDRAIQLALASKAMAGKVQQ